MRNFILLVLLSFILFSCIKESADSNPLQSEISRNYLNDALKLNISNIDSLVNAYKEKDYPFVIYNGVPVETVFADSIAFLSRNDTLVFHPLLTAICVITLYTRYHEDGDENDRKVLLKNLQYLEENLTEEFYCEYNFPIWETHCANAPWISGLAQGEICTAFCRGYLLTGDERYLEIAKKILRTLITNSEEYWCVYTDPNNYYWIEEYPNPDKCHVLNGMMFALWGVWEYYTITEDNDAKDILLAGLRSIADHCCTFWIDDNLRYSKYCKHGEASAAYHRLHFKLFKAFYDQFKIPEFNTAYELYYNMYYHP